VSTPRQSVEIMRQIRSRTSDPTTSSSGTWVSGVVAVDQILGVSGAEVHLDSGGIVNTSSSIDEATPPGTRVWVLTPDGRSYLIVGLQS
jgi:hypothetical protein